MQGSVTAAWGGRKDAGGAHGTTEGQGGFIFVLFGCIGVQSRRNWAGGREEEATSGSG
jgi:hypothetical protein